MPDRGSQPLQGLTLDIYALAKHLKPEFLKRLGVINRAINGVPVLKIPYLNQNCEEVGTRHRLSMDGNNRFRWAKRSHIIPYGVWMLQEALQCCMVSEGDLPYIILVEGESDTQTLWSYDIPALGIPGATTWKPEWKDYITGYKVFIWREPDAGGDQFVTRICQDLPDALIITPPTGRKDISECHILGDNIPQLITSLRATAVPYKSIQNDNQAAEAHAAYQIAEDLLHSDILSEFDALMTDMGLVGEKENAKLIYLAVTSRLLDDPVSIVVKGPSSGGKSFLVGTILKMVPAEAYYALSAMSEHALAYSQEPLTHRMLIIYEAVGLNSEFASYLLRSLLSESRVRYETVEKTDKGLVSRLIEREGPTGVILTTTWAGLHPENETRMLSIDVHDDRDQTRAIVLNQGLKAMGEILTPPDLTIWHALQTWLAIDGYKEVVIPYGNILAQHTCDDAIRMRRDFPKILACVKATALLYQCQRDSNSQGKIIATIDDYAKVYELVQDPISEAVEISVSTEVRETVSAVAELLHGKKSGSTLSLTDLGNKLELDKSAVSRRVKVAVKLGYLDNLEDRKGKPAKIVLGEPMPIDFMALPHPDKIRKIFAVSPSESFATAQQFQVKPITHKSEFRCTSYQSRTISPKELAKKAYYPNTQKPCPGCGQVAWRERSYETGGGYYCSVCHP